MRRSALSHARFVLLLLVALGGLASSVSAQPESEAPEGHWVPLKPRGELPGVFDADPTVRLFGVTLLTGIPDGIAPGLSFHPGTNVVHFDLSLSGLLALGVRGGLTFDPFDWLVAPTLTVAAGYNGWTRLPSNDVYFRAYYVNAQVGLEFGRRSRFRLFVRGGYSHFWVTGRHSSIYQGVQVTSPPSLRISALPSVNVGLTAYFGQ